ncbi:hypothetical protein NDN08_007324 [Rhodosorus marinus]|uniref:PHD-type domain-containing protein n=1 Tax=Rhodosorus marinus TaxID=101924 RepID=A0AAV8UK83_9RHOD|nr:hypothetical protein NDN08_007324 [Rhodosorus marinus]
MMEGDVVSSRVRSLRAKIDRVKSKVSGGVEGVCESEEVGALRRYGEAGGESFGADVLPEDVPFKETVNGRQMSEQLKDIKRTCGVGLSDEFIETSVGAARDAWYRREKSSFKRYCAEDNDVLRASRDYLNQSHYLKPSLYPLLWELGKEFRGTVARAYDEQLPEPLTYNDIDPRRAIERFMTPSHPKKDPAASDGDDSGVTTRLRRAQEELFQADDTTKPRPERQSSLKRENSYTLSAKNPNAGRLFRSKEMMLARKRGAHCGLCPPLEREEEEQLMTELVGPFPKRDGSMSLFVHLECLLWAPEVYTDGHGNFRMVYEVYNRGRKLVCATCGVKGATIGCYVESCRKSYHFACLKKGSCRLVEEHFVCFCPKHRGRADTAIFKQIISAASAAAKARTEVKVDTTYGLDTPHSFFTGLRRGQQEVIFSLIWGVTTIPNVEHVEESLFSLKRRAVVKKSDRLRLRDGVRVIKHSVYNVASDQLALKANKVYRHSSLAPPQRQRVIMVRNFRGCQPFAPGAMRLIESQSIPPPPAPAFAIKPERDDKRVEPPASSWGAEEAHVVSQTAMATDRPLPSTDLVEQAVGAGSSAENEPRLHDATVDNPLIQSLVPNARTQQERTGAEDRLPAGQRVPDPVETTKEKKMEVTPVSGASEKLAGAAPASTPGNDAEKRKPEEAVAAPVSGWLLFLVETLEEEGENDPDALQDPLLKRNVASLWSRLSVEAREDYERKAIQLDRSGVDEAKFLEQAGLQHAIKGGRDRRSYMRKSRKRGRDGERKQKFYNIYREID